MAIFSRVSKTNIPKSKAPKRVTFVDKNIVNQVEIFENKEDIWFSHKDETFFKQRDFEMIQLLQTMDPSQLEIIYKESSRGLEHVQQEVGRIFHNRRTNSVAAVVATQKLFQRIGKDGCDSIARAYGSITVSAAQDAVVRAEGDEKFVADHVRVAEYLESRTFEKRPARPSIMGRQNARRSIDMTNN